MSARVTPGASRASIYIYIRILPKPTHMQDLSIIPRALVAFGRRHTHSLARESHKFSPSFRLLGAVYVLFAPVAGVAVFALFFSSLLFFVLFRLLFYGRASL